jgi:hypothetical protein
MDHGNPKPHSIVKPDSPTRRRLELLHEVAALELFDTGEPYDPNIGGTDAPVPVPD